MKVIRQSQFASRVTTCYPGKGIPASGDSAPIPPIPHEPVDLLSRLADVTSLIVFASTCPLTLSADATEFGTISGLLGEHCLDCHGGSDPEGGLDLTRFAESSASMREPAEADLAMWIKIYDRVAVGEMPPQGVMPLSDQERLMDALHDPLESLDRRVVHRDGRAVRRRLNRFEYQNSMRASLDAPWLQLASMLPEDGELHRFNKLGEALDVSHVNLARYMQAAEYALGEVIARELARPETPTIRYYASEQGSFNRAKYLRNGRVVAPGRIDSTRCGSPVSVATSKLAESTRQ